MPTVKVKKLRPGACLPTRATQGSAGYDLYACLSAPVTIHPGQCIVIPLGIAIELTDRNSVALVFGRSGLGVRHGIMPANAVGVLDSDYRGEIAVGLRNHSGAPYTFNPGDRVAQMVITPVLLPTMEEAAELSPTERGAGGFGSTSR